MNEKDKMTVKTIIDYCDRLQDHILFFGDSKEEYVVNKQYRYY
jgi:hypothetical protein